MDKGRINIARAILRFGGDKSVPKSIEAQVLPDSPGGFIAGINYGGEQDDEEEQDDEDSSDEESDLKKRNRKMKLSNYKNRQALIKSLTKK